MNKIEASLAYLVIMHGAVALDAMGDQVRPDLFEDESCQLIVKEAMRLHGAGKYVAAETMPKNTFPAIQEVLQAESTSMAYLEHHIGELHQLAKYRKAQRIAERLAASTEDSDFDVLFLKTTSDIEETEEAEESVSPIKDSLANSLKRIETQYASKRRLLGFKTGYTIVSTRTQGAQKGKLWLLGGLPSAGKSLIAQNWAKAAMVTDDADVHVVSMEMSEDDWMRRFLADFSGTDLDDAVMTKDPAAASRIKQAANSIAQLPFTMSDKGGISLYTLKRQMKSQARSGKNFFIIDHLGLLNHGKSEIEGYKQTTSWLKSFAKKHDVFVLVLCQLNGKGEQDAMDGKEPRQGHIAYGSSGPNQDADIIFIITRDQELFCVKQRNGLMNWSVQLTMDGPRCRITEEQYD